MDAGEERLEFTPDEANLNNDFLLLLKKDLVAEKILSFVDLEDMKALSEVSVCALQVVRRTQQFTNSARQNISEEVLANESAFTWKRKHISTDLGVPVDAITDVLQGAESAHLKLPQQPLEDSVVTHRLKRTLQSTETLKTLGLEVAILSKDIDDFFFSPDVRHVLSGIQCLEIRNSPDEPYHYMDEDDQSANLKRSLFHVSTLPLQLERFTLGKVVSSGGHGDPFQFIPDIIRAAKGTLEELELRSDTRKYAEMDGITCPKLRRLTLSTCEGQLALPFLQNQPHLEELSITHGNDFLVNVLLAALKGKLVKIKKLHLKAMRFVGNSSPVDWNFLLGMTKLKDFSIRKPVPFGWTQDDDCSNGQHGENIIRKLPSHIQKIGVHGFRDFWDESEPRPPNSPINIGKLIARFQHLTELDLLRCNNSISDEGLQTLIANCPRLLYLTFSHCYEITDYGISGVQDLDRGKNPPEKTGASLDELTGLISLTIGACPHLTAEAMLKVVNFENLQSFTYYQNMPEDFILQIVAQNPTLVKVRMHVVPAFCTEKINKELKRTNPRTIFTQLPEASDWEMTDMENDDPEFVSGGDGGRHSRILHGIEVDSDGEQSSDEEFDINF